jgi:hypothetical protein
MKLVVRAFVLGVFVAGASAAVVSSHAAANVVKATPSHQAVAANMPIPNCNPNGNCTGTGR